MLADAHLPYLSRVGSRHLRYRFTHFLQREGDAPAALLRGYDLPARAVHHLNVRRVSLLKLQPLVGQGGARSGVGVEPAPDEFPPVYQHLSPGLGDRPAHVIVNPGGIVGLEFCNIGRGMGLPPGHAARFSDLLQSETAGNDGLGSQGLPRPPGVHFRRHYPGDILLHAHFPDFFRLMHVHPQDRLLPFLRLQDFREGGPVLSGRRRLAAPSKSASFPAESESHHEQGYHKPAQRKHQPNLNSYGDRVRLYFLSRPSKYADAKQSPPRTSRGTRILQRRAGLPT